MYSDFPRTRYKIASQIGQYPAGTECWAWRDRVLRLLFDDDTSGEGISMVRNSYAVGIEKPLTLGEVVERELIQYMSKDICKEIDREILGELSR